MEQAQTTVSSEITACFDARIAALEERKGTVLAECAAISVAKEKRLSAQRTGLESSLSSITVSQRHCRYLIRHASLACIRACMRARACVCVYVCGCVAVPVSTSVNLGVCVCVCM